MMITGGGGLLKKYGGSPAGLVQGVFRGHPWQTWRFKGGDKTTSKALREFFEGMAPLLRIQEPKEWMGVSFQALAGAEGMDAKACWHIKKLGLLPALLKAYPELHEELKLASLPLLTTPRAETGDHLQANLYSSQHYLACVLREYVHYLFLS